MTGERLAEAIAPGDPTKSIVRYGMVTGIAGMADSPPTIEIDVGGSGTPVSMRFTRGWAPVVGLPIMVLWDGPDPVAAQAYSNYRSDWIYPALNAPWANYAAALGGDYRNASYRRIGDIVYLRGLVTGGTYATILFNLPGGFRPLHHEVFDVGAGGVRVGQIFVATNGDVSRSAVASDGGSDYITLGSIQFSVND